MFWKWGLFWYLYHLDNDLFAIHYSLSFAVPPYAVNPSLTSQILPIGVLWIPVKNHYWILYTKNLFSDTLLSLWKDVQQYLSWVTPSNTTKIIKFYPECLWRKVSTDVTLPTPINRIINLRIKNLIISVFAKEIIYEYEHEEICVIIDKKIIQICTKSLTII